MNVREKSITTGKKDTAAAASSAAPRLNIVAPIAYTATTSTSRKKVMTSRPLNSDSPKRA